MNGLLAYGMALAHLSLIVFLIIGAWLTIRWPRLRQWHLVAIGATAAVFLAGADCPLTVWENHFREAAGWPTYGNGFVVHYVIEPLTGVRRLGPARQGLVAAAWVLPTLLGYLVASGSGSRRPDEGIRSQNQTRGATSLLVSSWRGRVR